MSSLRRKKVLLLLAGGTALSVKRPRETSVLKASDVDNWLEKMPEIKIMADIDAIFITSGEELEVNPSLWERFIKEISKNYQKYDGYIITHEVDTISHSAAALSFMIQNLDKPIILTGSQISTKHKLSPETYITIFKGYGDLGVKANLTNAIQVATQNIAEVSVMFGNRLIRGTRISKTDTSLLNVFESFKLTPLGEADFSVKLSDRQYKRKKLKPKFFPQLDDKVQLIELHPNLTVQNLEAIKDKSGIIIKVYDSGLLPPALKVYLEKLAEQIPIILHTSLKYEHESIRSNLLIINKMTLESTLAKLMWLLTQTKNPRQIRKMMLINYAGELN